MVPEPKEGGEGQAVADGGGAVDEPNWNARNDH